MSSSTAKILRSPARKIACESATMTRINCSRFSIDGGANLGSPVLIAGLAISSSPLTALESILVDYAAAPPPRTIVRDASHTSLALHLHVGFCANYIRGQRDREF